MGAIRENVKRNLGYYLSLNGVSQKELANHLGVSQAAVTNWIKGKNAPDIEAVAKICSFLNISVNDLFGTESKNQLTPHEQNLINSYRNKPEIQPAVNILLDLSTDK